ncbi:MAG: ATP-binding protein [Gallionella sp.]|nr:ATP-binding protein [Gallionella sp.]
MNPASALFSSFAINLRRLVVLRCIALSGQLIVVWVVVANLHMALPLRPLIGIIAAMALFNFLTWLRMRRPWSVVEAELFAHLVLDVAALTALLYFSGGATNPFVILYLLPLALTAAALPAGYAWAMVAVSIACYTLLLFYYIPLPQSHAEHDDFGLHVYGMWLGFLLSAGLIAWFAVRMGETRRSRDRLLAQMREDELRNERIVALGTLAAGAAHELGTPLSTMAVLSKEMEHDAGISPSMRENVSVLRQQIDRCKSILSSLSASAGASRAEGGRSVRLENYLADIVNHWQEMRRGVSVRRHFEGTQPSPEIIAEQTMSQAIVNILNNAADSSPENIDIGARWNEQELVLEISDRGAGLTPDAVRAAGQPFFTTKAPGQGLGLGLFLAHATLRRLGGSVQMYNREGGGLCTQLVMPLSSLRVKRSS